MQLPQEAKEVVLRFAAKFGVPQVDTQGQEWSHKLAQQLTFSFPGQGYCHKSAGPGRPHSSDVIARQFPDGKFLGWDLITALGDVENPGGTLNVHAESIDLAGQIAEGVNGVDWIGQAPQPQPQPEPEPEPTPDPGYQAAVIARLDAILAELTWQRKAVESGVLELKKGGAMLQGLVPQLLEFITKGIKIRF